MSRRTLVVGVSSQSGLRGKSLVAHALAGFLGDFSGREVLLLRALSPGDGHGSRGDTLSLAALAEAPVERIKSELKNRDDRPASLALEVHSDAGPELLTGQISKLLAKLGESFPYVVLEAGARPAALRASVDEICDLSVEVVAGPGPPPGTSAADTRRYRVVNLSNPGSRPLPINHCEPFVLAADPELADRDPAAALAYLRENKRTLTSVSLRRLARKLLGATVGVAVGGGAAFGIAHAGVLRVFEDNDIPVDLLAGTSMGSIIALGYAAGRRAPEMWEFARRKGNLSTTLSALDLTLTRPGLLAGNRIMEIFRPLLGDVETFEQLLLPCQVVASDIRSGERVTIGSGRLDAAFRCSCSVPMLMTPVQRNGRVLVDGGLVEPVPVQVISEMGADICIGVNVVPPLRKGVETALSRGYRRLNALNPLAYLGGARGLPNTFDVVMNSIQTLQHQLGSFKAIAADVRIEPDLSEFTWIEFYRALELIERGAEAAERAIPEIRRVLAERIGSPLPPPLQ